MNKRNMRHLLPLILLLFAVGCQHEPQQSAEKSTCAALDSLVQQIDRFQAAVDRPERPDANAELLLQQLVTGLKSNQTGPKECNYLNEKAHPDHLRFEFTDGLTAWTIRDTFTDGIFHLIELRGVFSDDSAISEYFSEEIARVALENPTCYLQYFHEHPAQQQLLLNSTKWARPDLPKHIAGFKHLDPNGKIVQFLSNLSATQAITLP